MIFLIVKQLHAVDIVSESEEIERGKEDGERRQEGIVRIEVNSYLCERRDTKRNDTVAV